MSRQLVTYQDLNEEQFENVIDMEFEKHDQFKKGDRVILISNMGLGESNPDKVFEIASGPFPAGEGWQVRLKGETGTFSCAMLEKVEE